MELRLVTKENIFSEFSDQNRPWQEEYLAMYSSWWQGATRDPDLMVVPVDDHLVHRGDGVFEVMRCVRGRIYQMEGHIKRLERSATAISIDFPPEYREIREIINQLVAMGGEKECLIRVVLSRGPGGFTTDPFECPSSQIYINVIRFRDLPDEYYRDGIQLLTSKVPIKKSFFANIKSCNYLPNVLMKLEAIKADCRFSVALDEDGFLAEGSTENIAVLTSDNVLRFPGFERTLSGITARRVFELAGMLVEENMIEDVKFSKISREEAYQAKEIFLCGTSLNILPVAIYDGRHIGVGSPGPVYFRLSSLLWNDMTGNQDLLTEIYWNSGDSISGENRGNKVME